MRILLYVNSHLPQVGGRELVVHNLALQFKEKGHDVIVGGASGRRKYRGKSFGYPVDRWPVISAFPDLSRFVALVAFSLAHRFDVVHSHVTYPCGYIANRARSILRAPLVITPHGEDINVVPEIGFGQRLDPVQKRKIDEAVRGAHLTTAISDTIAASLEEAGALPRNIARIPNGVDLKRFSGRHIGNTLARFQLAEDAKIIVSTGNYHPRKGHRVLVEAVAQARRKIPNIVLIIVGKTSDAFCKEIEELGYSGFVKFAGLLPVPMPGSVAEDPLADLLRAAVLYVSSSMDEGAEGLSLALLEAMAAGVCPIVTNISGNRDIIDHEKNGVVVAPRDAQAMGNAIVDLLTQLERTSELARNAGIKVSEFGWDRIADQYIDAYEQLIATYRSGSTAMR